MAGQVKLANNAYTTLSVGCTNVATTLVVTSSATFPAVTTVSGNWFYACLQDTVANLEIVKVTDVSGTTWTVTRGVGGTTGRAFASGSVVELRLTAETMTDFFGLPTFTNVIATGTSTVPAVAIGGNPFSGWSNAGFQVLDFNNGGSVWSSSTGASGSMEIAANLYNNVSTKYKTTNYAAAIQLNQDIGQMVLAVYPSGTAGSAVGTAAASMVVDQTGEFSVSAPAGPLMSLYYGATRMARWIAGSVSSFLYGPDDANAHITLAGAGSTPAGAIRFYPNSAESVRMLGNGRTLMGSTFVDDGVSTLQVAGIVKAQQLTMTDGNYGVEIGNANFYIVGGGVTDLGINSDVGSIFLAIGAFPKLRIDTTQVQSNVMINLAAGQLKFPSTQVPSSDANTLDDYEEGTWTPNQGAGWAVTGTFGSSAKYTKIGNQVTVNGRFTATTSMSLSAGTQMCNNLPFTCNSDGVGSWTNASGLSAGATVAISGGTVLAGSVIGSTSTVFFSCTYFV